MFAFFVYSKCLGRIGMFQHAHDAKAYSNEWALHYPNDVPTIKFERRW